MYRTITLSLFLLFASFFGAKAQTKLLHHDNEMLVAINQGLNHLYNFEFEQAEPYFLEIKKKYPSHPAYPFSQALKLFTKNFPMKPGHPDYKNFELHVNDCLNKSLAILDKDPENADGIFCALSAQSYQALMFSFSKDYLQAINSARKVYGFIKEGFDKKKEFPDFNYSSGLFYYYADQYPKTHPMVKPFMLFFENGNKEMGINNLNVSMLKGVYTRQESLILLSYIYIKYENNPQKSLEYSEKLYFNYPNNPFALSKYIEGLLFSSNFAKAKEMLPKLQATTSDYFKVLAEVYTGYLVEKHDKRNDLAKEHYFKALIMCRKLFQKTDDPQSFCYLGLGRIADAEKDRKRAMLFYRKAESMAEYEMVKIECKQRMQPNGRSLPQH